MASAEHRRGWRHLWDRCFAPVDAASLAVFRIGFGTIMAWEVWRYFHYGWIDLLWSRPAFHFKYYGFGWVVPWPGRGMQIHLYVLGALALCIALGLAYRASAFLFFLGFSYIFLLDQTTYLNHFYLVCLISFLMIFVPAHRACSVDARRRPSIGSGLAPAWSLWLLRAQIGIAYAYGGLAKLNGDWLRGEPMRGWLGEQRDFPLIGRWFGEEWMVRLFSYGGLLLDLSIVPLLLWRRTRLAAFVIAVTFHLTNSRLFDIGIFPWFMIVATTLFFAPDWPRRFAGALFAPPRGESVPRGAHRGVIAVLVCAYLLLQVLFPLRHWLYPGTVLWNEEGLRFAWFMKAYWKQPEVRFHVTEPASGRTWEVDASEYLTDFQLREMRRQPDMILQFSHYLAQRLRRAGQPRPLVHVRAAASLNGRKPQWLIDPGVDLAAQPRNLAPAPWIVPLTTPFSTRLAEGDFEALLGPSGVALSRQARERMSAGRPSEALELMREAVQNDPGNAGLQGELAEIQHKTGDTAAALAGYRRALELDPDDARVRINLGKALAETGRLDQALEQFRSALASSPEDAAAHYNLGLGLLMSGNAVAALEELRLASRWRPEWVDPLHVRASILASHADAGVRDPHEAVRLAERAVSLSHPATAPVLDTLAQAYAAAGRFDLARSTATRALELAGNTVLADGIRRRLELYRHDRPYVQRRIAARGETHD